MKLTGRNILLAAAALAIAILSARALGAGRMIRVAVTTVTVYADRLGERNLANAKSPVVTWRDLTAAGGPATQDAARVTNPTTQITGGYILDLHNVAGEYVAVRLKYDRGLTGITNPKGGVFGRAGAAGGWMRLNSLGGSDGVTLTTDTTNDIDDGTFKYTGVINATCVYDRMGCDQFAWGTETALNGTGTKTNAVVQLKPL